MSDEHQTITVANVVYTDLSFDCPLYTVFE
jgi:hypothetical protein